MGSLAAYWRFQDAVARAQLKAWLPVTGRVLVDNLLVDNHVEPPSFVANNPLWVSRKPSLVVRNCTCSMEPSIGRITDQDRPESVV